MFVYCDYLKYLNYWNKMYNYCWFWFVCDLVLILWCYIVLLGIFGFSILLISVWYIVSICYLFLRINDKLNFNWGFFFFLWNWNYCFNIIYVFIIEYEK